MVKRASVRCEVVHFFYFFQHPNHYLVTCCELAAGFVPRVVEDALVYCRHDGLTLIERQVCASLLSVTVNMEYFLLRRCGSLDRSTANEGVGREVHHYESAVPILVVVVVVGRTEFFG